MGLTVVSVLRSGGQYQPWHVSRLQGQVKAITPAARFVCLSDVAVDCDRIDLLHDWPGWFAKIELFRPGLFAGPVIYLDLDTDVVGDIAPLSVREFTMLSDFYRPELPASGVMGWCDDAPGEVYEAFCADPHGAMARCRHRDCWGDQGFIASALNHAPSRFGREVVSYKVHCLKGVPDHAAIVAYHGVPKPWDVKS
ncbi:hypothetical protein [Thalassospira xiamenensis]|uniref:hypothetical protein n=1 Tax=Thalassospira xiamenensis TaxID=220697 RepID=UPI000DEDC4F6|nr:hypothetical protein [Thalassospira xiamenensis]